MKTKDYYFEHLDDITEYQGGREICTHEVIRILADDDRLSLDWTLRLHDTDTLYTLLRAICQQKDKPEYKPLITIIKDQIEGFM